MTRRAHGGFTIVELMITVAIVGILAAIGIVGYVKWVKKSKASEVGEIFAQFKAKEEVYQGEFGTYLSTGTDVAGGGWPVIAASGEPKLKVIEPRPAAWVTLGLNPAHDLYCEYAAVAGQGAPGTAWGMTLIASSEEQARPWMYIHAFCDWQQGGAKSEYGMSANRTLLVTQNEGQ
jgi:prepilin-type N-terminal cleavage/methylation domain-containing protein